MLENIRFNKEEEENNLKFAQHLSSFADIFVNDAFGTAHRGHASTTGITKFIPSVSFNCTFVDNHSYFWILNIYFF